MRRILDEEFFPDPKLDELSGLLGLPVVADESKTKKYRQQFLGAATKLMI